MKFNLLLFFTLFLSCSPHLTTLNQKKPYTAKGFAFIYNKNDFEKKIIKRKMNNETMQISLQKLKIGTLIKISNPKNNKNIVLKNTTRIKYPDFYKILITKPVAEELDLNLEIPIIEILEIKKNKSFVAEKAKIFKEEKKIPSKAPVATVQISNISKNKEKKLKKNNDNIFIHVATFYSLDTAEFLKNRIIKDVTNLDKRKIKIKKINNKETRVILGPYISVNSLKNDYIKLETFGFEELDVFINE